LTHDSAIGVDGTFGAGSAGLDGEGFVDVGAVFFVPK
jgi:hypothetical protein